MPPKRKQTFPDSGDGGGVSESKHGSEDPNVPKKRKTKPPPSAWEVWTKKKATAKRAKNKTKKEANDLVEVQFDVERTSTVRMSLSKAIKKPWLWGLRYVVSNISKITYLGSHFFNMFLTNWLQSTEAWDDKTIRWCFVAVSHQRKEKEKDTLVFRETRAQWNAMVVETGITEDQPCSAYLTQARGRNT